MYWGKSDSGREKIVMRKGKDKFGLDRQYLKFIRSYTLCKGKVDYPFQWLMIEPTNRCNLRCVMCPQAGKMTREKGFMEFSLFRRILDEAADFVKAVQLFHSGESLLHPRIFDMIRSASSRDIYTLINTNATLLDENKARAVLDSGLNSISFSLDTFQKETYESLRIGARFEKTLKNVDFFLKLKAQRNNRLPHTIIEVIDMKDTRPHMRDFMRRARGMGFDEVRIWKFHNWTDADDVAEQHSPFATDTHAYYPCEYPFFLMAVYWNGTVAPCCIDYNGASTLGNVADTSLLEIWNNRRLNELRNTMRTRKTPKMRLCRDCSFLTEPRSTRSLWGRLFNEYARLVGLLRH